MMRSAILIPLILASLAGCTSPRAAPPVVTVAPPPPRPVAPPPASLAADWNDWPYTPGEWRHMQTATGSVASFGTGRPGGTVVALQCIAATRGIVLSIDWQSAGTATVRTTTMTRALTLAASNNSVPAVRIAASDPILDAVAFSRGRFVIEQAGQAPLVLPPHAEIGRVIEDCRG